MGLYIPPGSSNGGNSNDSGKKAPIKGDGNEKSFTFYTRPSIGLKIWGPLVPAADNLPAIGILLGIQTVMGSMMIRNLRKQWRTSSIFSKVVNAGAGTYLLYKAGLEIPRFILPYDPWYDEAKSARDKAIRNNESVNWWFGPWDFKPMTLQEWNAKLDNWIEEESESDEEFSQVNHEFKKVYLKLKQINRAKNSKILDELRQTSRDFKYILPNYQNFINAQLERPNLYIPEDLEPFITSDESIALDELWDINDPWEALGKDVDYIVRIIPKFRWPDDRLKLEQAKLVDLKSNDSGKSSDKLNLSNSFDGVILVQKISKPKAQTIELDSILVGTDIISSIPNSSLSCEMTCSESSIVMIGSYGNSIGSDFSMASRSRPSTLLEFKINFGITAS
ncbi:hypothetical protein WICMUC_001647 [Wickerhamomyces mucosus]|uniref:Mitochondrial inner membrane i-AAA protease complex subunit MGR1 n=1 Tax=Wickerhamomyces mucosus TaxID=1378264 RepID=A0A9P8PTS9_9ASCO|nr:hypothetical protein WICMUC_001647 [Wickerhamomyces mucosus]